MKTYEPQEFSVKVIGETTGEEYVGKFKCRRLLTHAQQLEVDRLRREFLGSMGDQASPRAQNQAAVLASLAVRLLEVAPFWEGSNRGFDLFDDNVIKEVYEAAIKSESDLIAEIQKRAEEAKKDLKTNG